jgi:hypothetical protein
MNVVQTGEGSALQRQKQQLRETAAKDEARAQELSRSGVDDLYTSVERLQDAADTQAKADALAEQSERLRRKGRRQSQRGLENLGNGSDRTAQGFAKTEKGLEGLKGSLDGLTAASEQKSQGLETAKEGLSEQAAENVVQGANLQKFSHLQGKDAKLDGQKAEQLGALEANLGEREVGLRRQGEQLDSYLIAGQSFAQGSAVKGEGFDQLKQSTVHSVEGEALNDARQGQELKHTWAAADQARHQDTSSDLAFSSLYQSLKAKAESLNAQYHKRNSDRDLRTAEGLTAQANDLKAQSAAAAQQARVLEQSGQCHVALGRQMQCAPWTYCQGVCLERQGCAELAEAQRLKGQAAEMRAESQRLAMQAEELRAHAEDSLARGEEFEVKSHGSATRSQLLDGRAQEHKSAGAEAGQAAEKAALAAAKLAAASETEKARAKELESQGVASLEQGFVQQEEALYRQDQLGSALAGELSAESELTAESQGTARDAIKVVGKEVSFIGRGRSLLSKIGASQGREAQAQAKVKSGIEGIEAGLGSSREAQLRGEEAAKMLEEARELELEGLRTQNRGQKMLLEARPKLAGAARLSAESFDAARKADRQEDEAARLIETGNQKIAAAAVLRDKAARYKDLAD